VGSRAGLGLLVGLALIASGAGGSATEPTQLRVKVFAGFQNLPLFAGQARGIFARHGLAIDLQITPNSPELRLDLATGAVEIAHGGVDNAIAMVETAGADVVIVLGGDNGLNELVVQPAIQSIADLRGRTLIVDAPNTAYALVARKILRVSGLEAGRDYAVKPVGATGLRLEAMRREPEYAASLLNPPFSILAERAGLRSLGSAVRVIGPYQATGAFVRRAWAEANSATLERYIQAYVEALRWVTAPANREDAVALLAERLGIPADVAARTCERAVTEGLAPDARLDLDGLRTVLALRAEIEGQWGGRAPAPEKYYDLRYYERALAALAR
jgi:ABC-type nitrate/sulfonate/bicarbonate transport system substrate-binding protein